MELLPRGVVDDAISIDNLYQSRYAVVCANFKQLVAAKRQGAITIWVDSKAAAEDEAGHDRFLASNIIDDFADAVCSDLWQLPAAFQSVGQKMQVIDDFADAVCSDLWQLPAAFQSIGQKMQEQAEAERSVARAGRGRAEYEAESTLAAALQRGSDAEGASYLDLREDALGLSESQFKFCMECGTRLPRSAKFCSSCGKKQLDIEG
eukprot:CAMPEP_0119344338 /NCGR_PEP_ID=MMETSP1333-20130426/106922_1 /TAXON_ID=418940 /ORGANISM="Scyphosphaera apsteinii, Strain RCC1455" /LENGTH=205 /DNA_ID=CAMNT_0007356777 /DNA_START=180 /DNA_END=797 /DNA_ORIENTATION=-